MITKGILLINLGSPQSPEVPDVKKYLAQFLDDPRVIDLPTLGRRLLLYGIILPFRPKRSAKAYRKIWLAEGSPLVIHTKNLAQKLKTKLQGKFQIEWGMRYGTPSIEQGVNNLLELGCTEITLVPLYPQYASSSTGTALEVVYKYLGSLWNVPAITLKQLPPFYNHEKYIEVLSSSIDKELKNNPSLDHLLFSYHGLPHRHIQKSEVCKNTCLKPEYSCCETISQANAYCYRAQCIATTKAVAQILNLKPDFYSTSFQSRLGRQPWILPNTSEIIPMLPKKGIKNLAVVCPSFVADCLETLEEIGIAAQESFTTAGGQSFRLIPCLNDSEEWVNVLGEMVEGM